MNPNLVWRRMAAALLAVSALLLGACSTPPAFQVSEPAARVGTVISITQDTVQNVNSTVGGIGGALIGGLLVGLLESLAGAYGSASMVDAVAFGAIILILLIRPNGLLGRAEAEKV